MYRYLLEQRTRRGTDVFELRLPGTRVICMGGARAARLFYDPTRFVREGAVPGTVVKSLFGAGAVQTLDGIEHAARKGALLEALGETSLPRLTELAGAEWGDAVREWRGGIVVFDEAAKVFARAVTGWAGAPFPAAGPDALAAKLVAMVDGAGGLGPRNWRGRMARADTQAWAEKVVRDVRAGRILAPADSAVQIMASQPLEPRLAAAELLNIVRPTTAVAWYVMFVAHALATHPQWCANLDESNAEAFVQEVRRFYPFVPLLAARASRDFEWDDVMFRRGTLVLLDLYGTNHDPDLWERPEVFSPERFLLGHAHTGFGFIPQGGGDVADGHRCPGEPVTLALMRQAALLLSRLDYVVPPQDLTIRLNRVPASVASGMVLSAVRSGSPWRPAARYGRNGPRPS